MYKSVWKSHKDRIKVYMISQTKIFIPVLLFLDQKEGSKWVLQALVFKFCLGFERDVFRLTKFSKK